MTTRWIEFIMYKGKDEKWPWVISKHTHYDGRTIGKDVAKFKTKMMADAYRKILTQFLRVHNAENLLGLIEVE